MFSNKGVKDKYYINPLTLTRSSGAMYKSIDCSFSFDQSHYGFFNYDNLIYGYDNKLIQTDLFGSLNNVIFEKVMSYIVLIYKILVLLTLKNF